MQSWPALPDVALLSVGPTSAELIAPYGRNSHRSDFLLVLPEERGTCSTKHALLAAVAREQNLLIVLTLGIYEMHERNTPGVGIVLDQHGLSAIPEAHCYLAYQGVRIDITRSGAEPTEPISRFLYEEAIVPEQIGDYKVQLHQRFLCDWIAEKGSPTSLSFAEIWRIREKCIAALAQ